MARIDQKTMRIVHSLSIAAFLGLASYLQMEQTVTLEADGSGKLTFEVTARIRAEDIKTPEDLVRRLAPRFEVIFDASGCQLPLA